MKSLLQPNGGTGSDSKLSVLDAINKYAGAKRLVLGDVATSPLELAGAYAAVANNGKFNAPSPILSITDDNGQNIPVKRPAGVQVVSPQIAMQAVQILGGDTQSSTSGTSASAFQNWYADHSSLVAGKTGTSVAVVNGNDTDKNASLWFVGMTPKFVATSALINFDAPNAPATELPNVSDPARNAYGAYASGVWLKALLPTLDKPSNDQWSWPDPSSADGTDVPDVTGMSLTDAAAKLKDAGFLMRQLDQADQLMCASSATYGTVAYYGPQRAPSGATITICPSSGVSQPVYVPPPPPPPVTKTKTKTTPPGRTHTTPVVGPTTKHHGPNPPPVN
jgi:membrane peptidoglycan carboxypeptidase